MIYFKKLLGDRIYLSPRGVSEEATDKFTEWLNDFSTTDYIGKSSDITSRESEKAFLEYSAKSEDGKLFDIVSLENDKLLGTASLNKINPVDRSAILGIFIGDEEYRNNGYGTETINLLLEFGFKYLNLHSIRLDLLSANERAHKCYLKCGFKDTGKDRSAIYLNGRYYDKLHMDILENEFTGDYIRNKNI